MKRLTIVDPTLRNFEGHNLDYALVVAEEAITAGWRIRILTHALFDKAAHFPAVVELRPMFSHGLKDISQMEHAAGRLWLSRHRLFGPPLRLLGRLLRKAGLMTLPNDEQLLLARAGAEWRDAARAMRQIDWTANERVFFPNLNWPQAAALARGVVEFGIPPLRWHGLIRFDPPILSTGREALRSALTACGDAVAWWSDTEPLAEAYAEIVRRPVSIARIPVHEAPIRAALDVPSPKRVRVGYFGESRPEKGFTRLPAAVAEVLAQDQTIEFTLQLMLPPAATAETVSAAIALRDMSSTSVQIIEGALDVPSLAHAMATTQVCLLPYRSAAYRLRSSGLLMNAILMDRVVVAPAGDNWLHHELLTQGADFVLVDDDAGLAEAVLAAVALARARPRASKPVAIKSQIGLSAPWLRPTES